MGIITNVQNANTKNGFKRSAVASTEIVTRNNHPVTDLDLFVACVRHAASKLPAVNGFPYTVNPAEIRENINIRVKGTWTYFDFGAVFETADLDKLDNILKLSVALYLSVLDSQLSTSNKFQKSIPDHYDATTPEVQKHMKRVSIIW